MAEERIYHVAYLIHQAYTGQDLAHDGHGVWQLAGDFLKQLIVPYDRHPLACKLTQDTVGFYCEQYAKAHAA